MLKPRITLVAALVALAPAAIAQSGQTGAATEASAKLAVIEPTTNTNVGHMLEILDGSGDKLLTQEQSPEDYTARKYWARIRDARSNNTINLRQYADRLLGAMSQDGRRAVVAVGPHVEIFDAGTGQPVAQRDFPGPVTCLDITRAGDQVALCIGNNTHVWVVQANEVAQATTHQAAANAAQIDPSDRVLYTAGNDGTIRRYDLTSKKVTGEVRAANARSLTALEIAPNGRRGTATAGNLILLWDPPTFQFVGEISSAQPVNAVALNSDGQMIVAASANSMRTYDVNTRKAVAELINVGEVKGRIVPNDTGATAAIHDTSAQAGGYFIRGWMAWKATAGGR